MKTLTIIKTISILSCISIGLIFSSCKKKKKDEGPAPDANGTVMLHLHTNVDTNEVGTYVTQTYTMTGGRKISVNISQLYLSGIQLVKTDGSTVDISGLNVLKVMQVEPYLLGSVPSGNYKSIRFNVGLAPSTNSLLPEPSDSTFYKPNMWFGNTVQPWQGYIFVNFQGKIDTSSAGNLPATQMQPFVYNIGTNTNLKTVVMPDKNYSVLPNQTQFIHIVIDYNMLFNGIHLNNSANLNMSTTAANSGTLAAQIVNNIPAMFRYEM